MSTSASEGARRVARVRRRRAAVLALGYVLFLGHLAHGVVSGRTLAPLEFSTSLQTVHRGVITAGACFFVATIVATAVYGRFFCGWGCHFLAAQDLAGAVLRRLGVSGAPAPWRALRAVPPLLVGYLYVWPFVPRLLGQAEAAPAADRWSGLLTADVWQGMPGPGITVLSFVVGAGAMVAVLGSRAFCHHVCPYGVFFAGADRLATRRVVLTGGCTGCNRCSEACLSGVNVLAELRLGGAVRDPACFRDLDCVAACPNGALELAPAPIQVRPARPPVAGAPLVQELVVGALTLGGFLALRGVYDLVPVLLALPAAVLFATLVARAVWGGEVRAKAVAAAVAIIVLHSGFIRLTEVRGEAAAARVRAGEPAALPEAVAAWERVRDYGLVTPAPVRSRLADLYLRAGNYRAAATELEAVVRLDPTDDGAAAALARVRTLGGERQEAGRPAP